MGLECVAVCIWGYFDNCVGVLATCVLVFTAFFIVSFMYIYSYFFVCTGVRTTGTD